MVVGKDVRHLGSMVDPAGRHMPRGLLFVGTHNAARSQIAEGWARKLFPAGVAVCSAGAEPSAEIDSHAVKVMHEVGIDISRQRPKPIGDVPLGDIDTVITVCAEGGCALPPGGLAQHHWALEDPGAVTGSEEEILGVFRKTREDLQRRLEELLEKSK